MQIDNHICQLVSVCTGKTGFNTQLLQWPVSMYIWQKCLQDLYQPTIMKQKETECVNCYSLNKMKPISLFLKALYIKQNKQLKAFCAFSHWNLFWSELKTFFLRVCVGGKLSNLLHKICPLCDMYIPGWMSNYSRFRQKSCGALLQFQTLEMLVSDAIL